jgi:hypothetical protein
MKAGDIERVKAEMARLQDMAVRLEIVKGENPNESAALLEGVAGLGAVSQAFQEAVDYAEGRRTAESDLKDFELEPFEPEPEPPAPEPEFPDSQ